MNKETGEIVQLPAEVDYSDAFTPLNEMEFNKLSHTSRKRRAHDLKHIRKAVVRELKRSYGRKLTPEEMHLVMDGKYEL